MSLLKLNIYQFFWYLLLIPYCNGVSRTVSGYDCISSCKSVNGKKPTCYYSRSSSETCIPTGEILEYFTKKGEKCNGRCAKFNYPEDWCFLESLSWDRCDSTPKLLSFLNKSTHNPFTTQEYCRLKNTPGNYVRRDDVTRTKRRVNNSKCNNVNNQCTTINPPIRIYLSEVDELIDRIFNDEDHFVTARYDIRNNPLIAVTTVEVPGDIRSRNPDLRSPVTLTLAMRARIRFSHMGSPRDSISTEVHTHLRRMDRENDDEAGHLLADSLGGSGAPFNFAPQSRMLNRAVTATGSLVVPSCWWDVEELIRRFLRLNRGGYVAWGLLVEYRLYPTSRRPTGFRLAITFYDNNSVLMDFEGGSVREYFFPNVPTVACSNLNHPWWSHWSSTQ